MVLGAVRRNVAVRSRNPDANNSLRLMTHDAMAAGILARARLHRMVEETTDEEAEIVLESFCHLNEREGADLALGKAFVEMYRARTAHLSQRHTPPSSR